MSKLCPKCPNCFQSICCLEREFGKNKIVIFKHNKGNKDKRWIL